MLFYFNIYVALFILNLNINLLQQYIVTKFKSQFAFLKKKLMIEIKKTVVKHLVYKNGRFKREL